MNKIAICDNNPKAKEQIRKCCEKYDAKEGNINEYYEFSSGEDLLASSLHFDLIFLDIEMDDLNGIETAEQIRKTDMNVLLIIVSGYSKYKTRAYGLHVFDYMANHFGPHRLSMCYKRLSDIRSSWKQNLLFFEQQRE